MIITNPNWNPRQLNNDIALIKLSRPVKMNKYVSPICLPSSDPPVGTECYITGTAARMHMFIIKCI